MSTDGERAADALRRVDSALTRLIDSGLDRLTPGALDELREMERVAHQGRLTRIERELSALAGLGARYLARDPTFVIGGWVGACERLENLRSAARSVLDTEQHPARDEILGVPRRTYVPMNGIVRVFALGASGWVSESGYCGITVYLWDGARVLQATKVLPVATIGNDPRRLLFQPLSEDTPLSIHELSHGAWDLDDVRLSSDGRLSLHGGLKASPAAPIGLRAYEAHHCADVTEVIERIAAREVDPVGWGAPILAYVEISGIRAVGTDETRARGRAEAVDRAGNVLEINVPLRPEHDLLLENLVRVGRLPPIGLFGRVSVGGRAVRIEPYTAIFAAPVSLALRRRNQVQEVHLGLEPLPGDVTVPAAARAEGAPVSPDVEQIRRALRPVSQLLERMYGTGLALPEPELVRELARLAHAWSAVEVEGLGGAMRRVVVALEGDRRGAHAALQELATRVRLMREGLAIHEVRLRQARAVPDEVPAGEDLDLWPVGVELAARGVLVHCVAAADHGWVVLEDEWLDFERADALSRPWPSRLFQGDVRLDQLLASTIEIRHHPVARTADRRWVRPYVRSAALLGAPAPPIELPAEPGARFPFRAPAVARRDPSGWWIEVGRLAPVLVEDPWLQVDLEKRSADGPVLRFEITAVVRKDKLVVFAVDGRWATVDPGATRFPLARLQRAAAGELVAAVDRLARRQLAPITTLLPADDSVPEQVAALRRSVSRGGVLPSVGELRILADAWCRTQAVDPQERPVSALALPRERLWLAIVAPVARWLAGDGVAPAEVRDALDLAVAAGEVGVLVE